MYMRSKQRNKVDNVLQEPGIGAEKDDDVQNFKVFEVVQALRRREVQAAVEEEVNMPGRPGMQAPSTSTSCPPNPVSANVQCTSPNEITVRAVIT